MSKYAKYEPNRWVTSEVVPSSEIQDPFYLTEDKNQYFDDGNWIIGNRRYIVSWKQRNRNESESHCTKMGLQMYNPFDDDRAALPHLKLWSRNVTMSQFWTSWTYKVENGNGMFLDSAGKQVAEQRSFIKYSDLTGRSNKNSLEFCVASQFYYEFRQQLPCSDNDKACSWSGISTVPTNCNNYLGTICQHKDHQKRLIVWNTEYVKSPDSLINDGMQATVEFGWQGNGQTRRSKFKQTFGSLVCPPKHRMLRQENDKWYAIPQTATEIYQYDFLDSYWVVDEEQFVKTQTSQCSISSPSTADGKQRKIQKVPCTEWHFYLCMWEKLEIRTSDNVLPYTPPKSDGWNWKRHARIYPIV